MAELRDPLSVSPATFTENTVGLSLIKSFGADMAKTKALSDKTAKASAIKILGQKYNGAWDIDDIKRIQPKVDELKEAYTTDMITYKGKLPLEKELEYNNQMNTILSEVGQSKQQQAEWNKQTALLLADKKDEGNYDHDLSTENLNIFKSPGEWLDDKDNATKHPELYAQVKADWDAADKNTYTFRATYPDKYSIVNRDIPFDFNKFTKQIVVKPDEFGKSTIDGGFIWDEKTATASYTKALIQGSIMYENLPEDQKTKAETAFEKVTDKSVETPTGTETFDNAKDYYANAAATKKYNEVKTAYSKIAKNIPTGSVAGADATQGEIIPNDEITFPVVTQAGPNVDIKGANTYGIKGYTDDDITINYYYDATSGGMKQMTKPLTGNVTALTTVNVGGKDYQLAVISTKTGKTFAIPLSYAKSQISEFLKTKKYKLKDDPYGVNPGSDTDTKVKVANKHGI
jgi:hypothetical protein